LFLVAILTLLINFDSQKTESKNIKLLATNQRKLLLKNYNFIRLMPEKKIERLTI